MSPLRSRLLITLALPAPATPGRAIDDAYPSVLGWHRDTPFDRPGLSRMDRLMLRIVYDPRLAPGMISAGVEALLADAKAASTN